MIDGDQGPSNRRPAIGKPAGLSIPASAPGVLIIHLDALVRNYAKLRAIAARPSARPWSRGRLMDWVRAHRSARWPPPDADVFCGDAGRGPRAARCFAGDGDPMSSMGCSRQRGGVRRRRAAAGARQPRRNRGMGGVLPGPARARRDPHRYGNEPPRAESTRAPRLRSAAGAAEWFPDQSLDEPSRLRGHARAP